MATTRLDARQFPQNARHVRIALPAAGLLLMAACGPFCSSNALGDACLTGKWVEKSQTSTGNWRFNGAAVAVRGLAGLTIEFASDGTETDDYNRSASLNGRYAGRELRIELRGRYTYHVHASGGRIVQSRAQGGITAAYYLDGVRQPEARAASPAVTETYTCTQSTLRITGPPHSGYGPQVDELRKG